MKPMRELNDSMDLTSMVDVTFLLLIFFVITASFVTTQMIPAEPAELASSSNDETPVTEVRVIVDEHDRYFVEIDGMEEPVSTQRELREVLRQARDDNNVEATTIDAHLASHHRAVIKVFDASKAVGLDRVRVNPYK